MLQETLPIRILAVPEQPAGSMLRKDASCFGSGVIFRRRAVWGRCRRFKASAVLMS